MSSFSRIAISGRIERGFYKPRGLKDLLVKLDVEFHVLSLDCRKNLKKNLDSYF